MPLKTIEHLVKQRRLSGLIRRVEQTEQPIAPADGRAGRVDAVVPVVLGIAVTLSQARRCGVAHKFPQSRQQPKGRGEPTLACRSIAPIAPTRFENAEMIGRRRIHHERLKSSSSWKQEARGQEPRAKSQEPKAKSQIRPRSISSRWKPSALAA